MATSPIPFYAPYLTGQEQAYLDELFKGGRFVGNGRFTGRCQDWLAQRLGAAAVLLTPSCTAALEMAAMLCGVGPGDEVIMPSFTFVSTANAFALRGAVPVFVDVDPGTLNMNADLLDAAVTERTRAIVPVHYAGYPCAMDAILAVARRHGLMVVEDAAQACLSTDQGRPAGTIGQFGCFSFHETKNIICGEGGALVINDADKVQAAEILREKGTNRSAFLRGAVDKYTWVGLGSSYLPSELQAAFLLAQLEAGDAICQRRRDICDRYGELLTPLADAGLVRLSRHTGAANGNGHLFYVLTNTAGERDDLIAWLQARGITAPFHYVPLHTSSAGQHLGRAAGELPVTEWASVRLLRLPLYPAMTDGDIMRVAAAIHEFFKVPFLIA